MFVSRMRLGWALAAVVVLAAALLPAAGAVVGGVKPTGPWYAYDAALRKAQHQRQQHLARDIPTGPWYAYDAALRKAQHKRQQHLFSGIQPASPWYAYDAALRKAQQHRIVVLRNQRVG